MRAQTLRTMVLFYGTEDGDGPGLYSTSIPNTSVTMPSVRRRPIRHARGVGQ